MNDIELAVKVRETSIDVIQFKCAIWGWVIYGTWGKIDGDYSGVGKLESHCYCPVKIKPDSGAKTDKYRQNVYQLPVPKPRFERQDFTR